MITRTFSVTETFLSSPASSRGKPGACSGPESLALQLYELLISELLQTESHLRSENNATGSVHLLRGTLSTCPPVSEDLGGH